MSTATNLEPTGDRREMLPVSDQATHAFWYRTYCDRVANLRTRLHHAEDVHNVAEADRLFVLLAAARASRAYHLENMS